MINIRLFYVEGEEKMGKCPDAERGCIDGDCAEDILGERWQRFSGAL